MWYSIYTVDDMDIDQEHENIDAMLSCIDNKDEKGKEHLEHLINALCRHFANEERIATERGYQMSEQHMARHRELEEHLTLIKGGLGSPDTDCESIASAIKEILRTHIVEFDRFIVPKESHPQTT